MNIENLVKMVNEIGSFFAGESPPGQAPRDVANHLRRYWDPRMRRQIIAHFKRGGAGLEDLGRSAVGILAAEASPAAPPGTPAKPPAGAP